MHTSGVYAVSYSVTELTNGGDEVAYIVGVLEGYSDVVW